MTAFNNEVEHYRQFLLRQQEGRGMPWENGEMIFQGRRAQRGFGFFGSFLGNIGKIALPIVKRVGKQVLKQAVEIGKDVILEGKKPKEALKQRGKELIRDVISGVQTGSGRRRKRKGLSFDDSELWLPPRKAKSRRI